MSETITRTAGYDRIEDLLEKLERKNEAFSALFGLFKNLGTNSTPGEVIDRFAGILVSRIGYEKVAVYLSRCGKDVMEPYAAYGDESVDLPALYIALPSVEWLSDRDNFVDMDDFPGSGEGVREASSGLESLAGRGYVSAMTINIEDEIAGAVLLGEIKDGELSEPDSDLIEILSRVSSIIVRTLWMNMETEYSKMELERFSNVKKRFIGHTSHELRTPLTVIKSAVDSIEGRETDQELLSMTRDAVEDLQNIVEMLLSYNDIELREDAFDIVLTDATSVVKDCIRELARDFEENNVTMSIDNRAGRVLVMMDRSKIKLVFKSLIENALNYVEENGRVEIEILISQEDPMEEGIELKDCCPGLEAESRELPALRKEAHGTAGEEDYPDTGKGSYFVCRIGDNGIGIPEKEIRFMSEPFRMASNSPLSGVRGLGMGLTISQRIISGHGGRLFCSSGEGKGSKFSVWLPIRSRISTMAEDQ